MYSVLNFDVMYILLKKIAFHETVNQIKDTIYLSSEQDQIFFST